MATLHVSPESALPMFVTIFNRINDVAHSKDNKV